MTRPAGFFRIAAVALALLAAGAAQAFSSGERRLDLVNVNTGERFSAVYWRDGRHDPLVLAELDAFMRDWRTGTVKVMDRGLYDLLWEIHADTGSDQPIHVHSAFRSSSTNTLLRSRGYAAARDSQHMKGTAVDFRIPGVGSAELRDVAMRLQAGGVGHYPRANSPFVHVDVAGVRHWPPLDRSKLMALFPDGRSAHVPADGRPLPGFREALENIAAGRPMPSAPPVPLPRPDRFPAAPAETAAVLHPPGIDPFPVSAFLPSPPHSEALAAFAPSVPGRERILVPGEEAARTFETVTATGKGPRLVRMPARPASREWRIGGVM